MEKNQLITQWFDLYKGSHPKSFIGNDAKRIAHDKTAQNFQ